MRWVSHGTQGCRDGDLYGTRMGVVWNPAVGMALPPLGMGPYYGGGMGGGIQPQCGPGMGGLRGPGFFLGGCANPWGAFEVFMGEILILVSFLSWSFFTFSLSSLLSDMWSKLEKAISLSFNLCGKIVDSQLSFNLCGKIVHHSSLLSH